MSTNYSDGSTDNRAKKLLPWAIAAVVALVGTNIATFVGLNGKKTELTTTQVELKKEEDLNGQLDQQYKDAVAQLEEMKGKNTELLADTAFIDGTFVPAKKGVLSLAEAIKAKVALSWSSAIALASLSDSAFTQQIPMKPDVLRMS